MRVPHYHTARLHHPHHPPTCPYTYLHAPHPTPPTYPTVVGVKISWDTVPIALALISAC